MIPKRTGYAITVPNYYGTPPTYTLKVSFTQAGDASLHINNSDVTDLIGTNRLKPASPGASLPSPSVPSAPSPAASCRRNDIGAVSAVAFLSVAVASRPAGANQQPGITLKPNTTVKVTNPAPVGAGNLYPVFGNAPPDCATGNAAVYCDTIPLKLDVPDIKRG